MASTAGSKPVSLRNSNRLPWKEVGSLVDGRSGTSGISCLVCREVLTGCSGLDGYERGLAVDSVANIHATMPMKKRPTFLMIF